MATVELQDVGYRQQQKQILANICWTLRRDEHWSVLGPNGSGKTTLLKIACGFLWPTSGRVLRLGQELLDLRELRKQIGWITADLAAQVPPRDTALDTVVSGRLAQVGLKHFSGSEPTRHDFDDAQAMLALLRCQHLANKPFGVLSQGERQQVLIARARMAEPLLLVLDEPCAGMDPGVRERFLRWLNRSIMGEAGPTVVLVTHHIEEIVPGIQRTLVLNDGRVYGSGRTGEVVTADMIEKVYQCSLERLEHVDGRLWPLWKI